MCCNTINMTKVLALPHVTLEDCHHYNAKITGKMNIHSYEILLHTIKQQGVHTEVMLLIEN